MRRTTYYILLQTAVDEFYNRNYLIISIKIISILDFGIGILILDKLDLFFFVLTRGQVVVEGGPL